jgi:hypothetical protein
MVEVEAIAPHQYRQQDRIIGEKYQADAVHVSLLELLKWARPVDIEVFSPIAMKTKDKHRYVRS